MRSQHCGSAPGLSRSKTGGAKGSCMGVRVDFSEAPVVQTGSAAGGCGGRGWVFRAFVGSHLKNRALHSSSCIWHCPISGVLLSSLLWAKGATAQGEPPEKHTKGLPDLSENEVQRSHRACLWSHSWSGNWLSSSQSPLHSESVPVLQY